MSPDIVIAQPVDDAVVALLAGHGEVMVNPGPEPFSARELTDHCGNAAALMAFMTERIDSSFLEHCPKLRVVAGALKGFDNIDVEACSSRGVAVSIVPDLLTEPTAELAIGLMISLSRNMLVGDCHVRSGSFQGWRPEFFGGSINGSTIGVVGAGRVGRAILKMLEGFRCKRLYHDARPLDIASDNIHGAHSEPLDSLIRQSDFVVLALPLTLETSGIVDSAFIEKMKSGSYLINPARGSLVDEAAVAKALNNGLIAGYAADVFEMEDWAQPGRPDRVHPALLKSGRTVFTPHIGSGVVDVRHQIVCSAATSIDAVLSGQLPESVINANSLVVDVAC